MTVIGALSSFRELGEMSPHKRASHPPNPIPLSPLDSKSGADFPGLIHSVEFGCLRLINQFGGYPLGV
jgi:hypothetical protein